ncbi:hypothetical protein SKAU_G00332750 [Synaphobranchus kaupii]|uniref:Uncharacterized protein n=1 Tax=Synaphobranchus kaupii TaxID=118154 RepID=A0A9Q1ELC4_SYNKA|nr:hypothetical protein SKAU_G00332750 [Synaphobranchus kaupii]
MSESPRLISLSVPHQAASTAVQVFVNSRVPLCLSSSAGQELNCRQGTQTLQKAPTIVFNLQSLPPASPQKDTQDIRETLALLELEFAEYRELTLTRISEAYLPLQQPEDHHHQCRENNTAIADLREEIAALRQDNQALRAQLASERGHAAQGKSLHHRPATPERAASGIHF